MSPTSWVIIIHERYYHIPTIQLDAKSRKPLFMVVEKVRILSFVGIGWSYSNKYYNRQFSMKEREQTIKELEQSRFVMQVLLDPKVFS